MKRKKFILAEKKTSALMVFIFALGLVLISNFAYTSLTDFPHVERELRGCLNCHKIQDYTPLNSDDTWYNHLCWDCHNDVKADFYETHSSRVIDNGYGNWTVECRACHDPHKHMQFWTYVDQSYLHQGTVLSFDETTLTGDGADLSQYVGMIVIPNITQPSFNYKITGVTTTTDPNDALEVDGPMDLTMVEEGIDFAIIYGKLIKDKIWGNTVKFFRPIGACDPDCNSFADGDTTYDGVCEVCHTLTTHFRANGLGPDQDHTNMGVGIPGKKCTDCHQHVLGFKGMGGGAHPTHVLDDNGPKLVNCTDCHKTFTGSIEFTDDKNLANTQICDNCHSAVDAGTAKSYWNNDPGTWVATEGETGYCGSCHDATQGNTAIGGGGDPAPNIIGDNLTYGFYKTGHGKDTGNFVALSWQDISATGNPAANKKCNDCHDLTVQHFNTSDDRLKTDFQNDANNSNCNQCHTLGLGDDNPDWYTTYTAFQSSAHSSKKCSECHDVHGATGPHPGMVKITGSDDQQDLCYNCHTEGDVQNSSISATEVGSHTGGDGETDLVDSEKGWGIDALIGRTVTNFTDNSSGKITDNGTTTITVSLSGGTDNDWDTGDEYGIMLVDDIEEAFSSYSGANNHDLGAAYTIGSSNYTLECVSCHNVHIVNGKYWEADQGDVSPVSRISTPSEPGNNLYIWGDESGEKMDDYAGSGTYRTPNGDIFAGDKLPAYTDFCNECHDAMPDPSAQAGAHGDLRFDNDPHGKYSANVPDNGALCPNWDNCGKGVKWSGDECTGTEAECWPVIPRGRGEQIWSKSAYLQEERISGINYVMSCTDCHETHGSNIRSMLRSNPNSGTGNTNWLTMCLNCHNSSSDFHNGMSCGNASCHGANSENERMTYTGTDTLHRMGQRYGDSSTRTFSSDLVLDMRFENNLKDSGSYRLDGTWTLNRPDSSQHSWCASDPAGTGSFAAGRFGNAVDVDNQPVEVGTEDCDWSTAEYKYSDTRDDNGLGHLHGGHGTWKFTEMKYNMTLEGWIYPTDDTKNKERKIIAKHTYGSGGYALALERFDVFGNDANLPGWSEGSLRVELMTNVNGGSGIDDCNGLRGAYSTVTIPTDRWTHVAATYDSTGPDRDNNDGSVGRVRIYVNGEDVTTSSSNLSSCYAQPGSGEDAMFPNSDFNITDPGGWHASALSIGGLNWSDTNNNFIGKIDELKIWNITKNATYLDEMVGPVITKVESMSGINKLYVSFNEGVDGSGGSGELVPADFVLTDFDDSRVICSVTHTAGDSTATLMLKASCPAGADAPLDTSNDIGTDTLAAASGAINDEYGTNTAFSDDVVTITALPSPSILSVEGVVGSSKLKVTFSSQVYASDNDTGVLVPGDFNLSVGSLGISSVQHTPGNPVAIITMNGVLTSGTLAAAGDAVFGPDPDNNPLGYVAFPDRNPVGTVAVTIAAQAAPSITRVEGAVNPAGVFDQLFVSFSEGVYSNTDQSGALGTGDFSYTDGNSSAGATGIADVTHTAGNSSAIITLNADLIDTDVGADTLAAVSGQIFNSINNAVSTTGQAITDYDCPAWGVNFPIENESQGSSTTMDETGMLTGTVSDPSTSFPDTDNDVFIGDESQTTNIAVSNNTCFRSPRAMTVEARVKPTEVDRGYGDNTFNRIFERRRNLLVTILNTDYRGDDVPERLNKASIEVKYRVESASRHNCPHPQWPYDSYIGLDTWMHQISSSIEDYPLYNNHWYQIKVVFNSDKSVVAAGSNGTPVDIFIDDQGVNGLNEPNDPPNFTDPDKEQWEGYKNASREINFSSSCRWGSLPGDVIELRNDLSYIGSNWKNDAQQFEGQIDWVTWKPVADYSGVDDSPY